jgi:hypothetical protein
MTMYTVFYEGGFLTDGNCGCHALEDFLTETVIGGMPPIAWAPVCYWDWARENPGRDCDVLRAESIAAGRTIELIDDRYVPRGVPVEDKPAKSIGAILRERMAGHGEGLGISHDRDDIFEDYSGPDVDGSYAEPQRPALTWADSKRVDRFPGFTVISGECDLHRPYEGLVHPLQRIAQEGDQLHGSAFLRKG